MTVSTYKQPDHTQNNASQYKNRLDGAFAVLRQIAQSGAPHATDPNSKKIKVDAIEHFDGGTIISQSEQTSAEFSFPSSEDRIDRVVFDESDLSISIVQGTEASSPSAPAIPSGKIPCCQVRLSPSDSTISNDMITDERKSFLFYSVNGSNVENATNVTSTYKDNDIDSDGDGTVDKADDSEAFDGLKPEDGNNEEVLTTDGTENGLSWGTGSNKEVFTSDGTFNVPADVSEIIVTASAGGGGGGGGQGGSDGSDGGNTSFGTEFTLEGGKGGTAADSSSDGSGGSSGEPQNPSSLNGNNGSQPTGGDGGGTSIGKHGSGGSQDAVGSNGEFGAGGGGGGGTQSNAFAGGGGGAGECLINNRKSVSSNQDISVTVGSGGNGGSGGGFGKSGGNGGDGIVIVQW